MLNGPQNSSAPTYVERVNQAIDYIVGSLREPLRIEDVARVAGFSAFHFHRVFRALVGETLHHFVKRVRLERALHLMSYGRRRSLTEIALASGFASSSDFSRSFKQRFGVPPSVFDIRTFREARRDNLAKTQDESMPAHRLERLPAGANPDGFTAELRELPARTVAYVRVPDPYRPGVVQAAAARLLAWAEARGLADGQWLGYMWDNPEIVTLEDCRYDVGVEVPDVKPSGEIGRFTFPPMTVAQVEVRGDIDLEMRALDWLFLTWLPNSRFVPAEQPCFESWIGRPFAHGLQYFEIFAQLPVVRAR